MTTIIAKVVLDSISPQNIRLTTLQLRYPRFIHAELMTHRVFSRNASSSRAVPVKRLIQDILDDTAMPIHWGKNQKGMQAVEECFENVLISNTHLFKGGIYSREEAWKQARDQAISIARAFDEAGYHKQIVNRLLEPFSHINVLVTSTYWANWFALRHHTDAQPEIHMLAREMKKAKDNSAPVLLYPGEWHLPYITYDDFDYSMNHDPNNPCDLAKKISTARCARVSYLTHDMKKPVIEDELKLYERLVVSEPLHASPSEHQATPDKPGTHTDYWQNSKYHGNFYGWIQNRKTLPNECVLENWEK